MKIIQTCTNCNGTGKITCPSCSGLQINIPGRIALGFPMPCEECNGKGKIICSTCKGTGRFVPNY